MLNCVESQKDVKKESPQDWHTADIQAAVKKTGTTFSQLSRDAGLKPRTLSNVLYRHWPKGEQIVGAAIGVEPAVIWPSRYQG
ncbi:helix-turn-helix domain-containing protein [Motilimonas cestriensis]|uniref:Helix-turn-helix domain-containing protein n=1 Tax=Motilimonas cestriensis TaxID=2742685 RepID=A0ABS8WAL5_9GAMM|nr:helix-turn-helix transcriptional regulator [Motilimonas cestriensis]MCE2594440.1 helix-turn-helix domain-containing protein [Motilimonas cestriensis]